jgi:hypothetical protein
VALPLAIGQPIHAELRKLSKCRAIDRRKVDPYPRFHDIIRSWTTAFAPGLGRYATGSRRFKCYGLKSAVLSAVPEAVLVSRSISESGTRVRPAILMSFSSPFFAISYSDVLPILSIWQASLID